MTAFERLAKPRLCRRCGRIIRAGTSLTDLDWDREERSWGHRKPSCAEARESPSGPESSSVRAGTPPIDAPDSNGPPLPAAHRGYSDDPTGGAGSVTLEVHEAADPVLSKRVLRLARLHLGTLAEAREVAEQLRKEL